MRKGRFPKARRRSNDLPTSEPLTGIVDAVLVTVVVLATPPGLDACAVFGSTCGFTWPVQLGWGDAGRAGGLLPQQARPPRRFGQPERKAESAMPQLEGDTHRQGAHDRSTLLRCQWLHSFNLLFTRRCSAG